MKGRAVSILGIAISLAVATGVAAAGSAGGSMVGGLPVFVLCAVAAFVIQWVAFVPAYIYQTEKYYDLTGSLTYISLALFAVLCSGATEPGNLLIAGMVVAWAVRLGTFLFARIRADGLDVRFTRIKPDFWRFLMTWTLQGLWVFMTFAAGLAAITSARSHPLDVVVFVGASLWLCGLIIEVLADRQKKNFRKVAGNADRFIDEGLWRWSRHPNYFGEILLWTGLAVVALPALSGWQLVTLISPVFVYFLLTRVSGVNMLEARANRRWGEDEDYRAYRKRTPALMLNPWAGRRAGE